MRALVVTNMYPSQAAPQRGVFVRDQVEALRRLGHDVDVHTLGAGGRRLAAGIAPLRRRLASASYDVVHAHYGLSGWVAWLAGARPLAVTFHGTDVRHRVVGPMSRRLVGQVALAAAVSETLFAPSHGRPGLPRAANTAVLPCGVDLSRFGRRDRSEARRRLGLEADGRYLLFPADPARERKRHDRAATVAAAADATLLTGGAIDPAAMSAHINAASAVLVPSDHEGFGLAALEALACDVAVLATPTGVAPAALAGIEGCLVAPFDHAAWTDHATRLLDADDPRIAGAARAEDYSADRMAEQVAAAWSELARTSGR